MGETRFSRVSEPLTMQSQGTLSRPSWHRIRRVLRFPRVSLNERDTLA